MAAGRIRDEDIVAVRERADIEAIVGQHVTLKRSGSSLKGLCPFHDEKSGSFYVSPARASWHCFGCGEGGDAIAFLMKVDNLTFVESVEYLASRPGSPCATKKDTPARPPNSAPPRRANAPAS